MLHVDGGTARAMSRIKFLKGAKWEFEEVWGVKPCSTVRNIGGSGGPPPEKFWNLGPLRLILMQSESQT